MNGQDALCGIRDFFATALKLAAFIPTLTVVIIREQFEQRKHGRCVSCDNWLHGGGGIGPVHCRNVKCAEYDNMENW